MKPKILVPTEERRVITDHRGHSIWIGTVFPPTADDHPVVCAANNRDFVSPAGDVELSLADEPESKDPYNRVGARL